ncbi:MAG: DUF92 domain-containing protein [Balneolaceae bacterium]
MDRIANTLAFFLLILIFLFEASAEDHLRIVLALGLSIIISLLSYIFGRITLDAIPAVVVIGTVALGLGDWVIAYLVLFFFISSTLLSRRIEDRFEGPGGLQVSGTKRERRDGTQAWSNGFWFTLFTAVWFLTGLEWMILSAATAIAVVTSDTWATEIGSGSTRKPRLLISMKRVEPGVDGAVSLRGLIGGAAGAASVALLYVLSVSGWSWTDFGIISLAGFFGCIFDSLLGSLFQQGDQKRTVRQRDRWTLMNNRVNWFASGVGALTAAMAGWFFV